MIAPMTIRENREWYRYALWAGSLVFVYLPRAGTAASTGDAGRLVICALGALLLGTAGFLLRTYRVDIDRQRRSVEFHERRPLRQWHRSVPFADIDAVLCVRTTQRDEDLLPSNRDVGRWRVALRAKGEVLTLTHNALVQRFAARALADEVARIVEVPVDDSAA